MTLHPPGYTMRACPVCKQKTGTHREPDRRNGGTEVVVYHQHNDSAGRSCDMVGVHAAIAAVAFTSVTP